MSSLHADVPKQKIARIFWPLLVMIIILSSEIAAICSLALLLPGQGGLPFLIAAPVAGLLVGLPSWWKYVILAQSATIKRGILVGCVGSIVAHPLMWTCLSIATNLRPISNLGINSSVLEIFFFSVISLLYAGWITTIIGGITGFLLILLQNILTQEIEFPEVNIVSFDKESD